MFLKPNVSIHDGFCFTKKARENSDIKTIVIIRQSILFH